MANQPAPAARLDLPVNDDIGEARFFPVDALPENRVPAHTIAGRVLRSL